MRRRRKRQGQKEETWETYLVPTPLSPFRFHSMFSHWRLKHLILDNTVKLKANRSLYTNRDCQFHLCEEENKNIAHPRSSKEKRPDPLFPLKRQEKRKRNACCSHMYGPVQEYMQFLEALVITLRETSCLEDKLEGIGVWNHLAGTRERHWFTLPRASSPKSWTWRSLTLRRRKEGTSAYCTTGYRSQAICK